jgi:hypothetical protein
MALVVSPPSAGVLEILQLMILMHGNFDRHLQFR